MKSIDKLREAATYNPAFSDNATRIVCNYLSEIEAEIAERYMELPVDADGVPIHISDVLECDANGYKGTFTVFAIGNNTVVGNHDIEWIRDNSSKWFHVASFCCHVKPRTLEDVLRDVWNEALDYAKSDMWRNPDEVFAERADEIRELLGKAGD